MARNSLVKEFNYDTSFNPDSIDFNVFKDKDELELLRRRVLEKIGDLSIKKEKITKEIVERIIDKEALGHNLTNLERNHLYNVVNEEINGYGPLSELLKDDSVEEIMVNSYNDIYTVINGEILKDNFVSFINEEHLIRTIKKMLSHTNIRLDKENIIETTLPDGSVLNIVMPPISMNGPTLTIKKFNPIVVDMDELVKLGTLTPYMARFLEASVKAKLNILVCGGSKSGKTSLLTSLANLSDDNIRLVCISNKDDLKVNKANKVNLTSNDNILNISLSMHPNTLVINNIDKELIAPSVDIMMDDNINVLSSINANNTIDVISNFESSYINSRAVTPRQVREILYNSIDLIITIAKVSNKNHKVISICEFNKNTNNEVILKEIFTYKNKEDIKKGEFQLFNYKPRAYKKIKKVGINLVDDIFEKLK